MEKVSTIAINLAKNYFQVFMSDKRGRKIKNIKIHRYALLCELDIIPKNDDLLIGMESSG